MKRFIAAICAVVLVTGAFIGYLFFTGEKPSQRSAPFVHEAAAPVYEPEKNTAPAEERITPSTKMIYEYYYMGDSNMETAQEEPPYFMIGKTRQEMEEAFLGWDIASFSKEQVVMRKYVEGTSTQSYTVGIKDGYVAVFYNKPIDGAKIKEITDTPVSSLPTLEQERLSNGITVSGEQALFRIMEDFGS